MGIKSRLKGTCKALHYTKLNINYYGEIPTGYYNLPFIDTHIQQPQNNARKSTKFHTIVAKFC